MKVLLVNGSPHKEGCTYTALKEVEKELITEGIETEIIWLGVKPISGCLGCAQCIKRGPNGEKPSLRCFMNDCVNEFLDKAEQADGFIFGSPVHYAALSGALTSFMDRAFYGKGKVFRYKRSRHRKRTPRRYDSRIRPGKQVLHYLVNAGSVIKVLEHGTWQHT